MQYMLANGCVKEQDFEAFVQKHTSGEMSQMNSAKVYQLVLQINKRIGPFNQMIRRTVDSVTRDSYYVLICTVDNAITHEAKQYSPLEYELFKVILKSIVDEPRGFITEQCIREKAEEVGVKNWKELLNVWVDKRWFQIVVKGDVENITLGVRSMAELDVYIKTVLKSDLPSFQPPREQVEE